MAPRCGSSGSVNVDFLDGSIVRAGQKVYIRVYLTLTPRRVRSSLDWLYFLIFSYILLYFVMPPFTTEKDADGLSNSTLRKVAKKLPSLY